MSTIRDRAKQAAVPIVQEAALQTGRATSRLRMTPDFLICGAQRCGTTSMYQALRQHPAVLRPVARKGVHYFDVHYDRGLSWYRSHFPLGVTARRHAHKVGMAVQTFESSPYYLFHPLSAERIAADLPGVKVLVLVRDPVERAYSAYSHEVARGHECESFERALELEGSRLAGEEARLAAEPTYRSHSHQHHAYIGRGRFVDQITRMEAAVGADRMLVIDAEDFFTDPDPVWADVVRHLGLPPAPNPQFRRYNARPRSALEPALRRTLEERFTDSDGRLTQWWGQIPSWRR